MKTGCWFLLALGLTACSKSSIQPSSSGRPYEVLLIGDSDSVVYQILDKNTEGLPQPEPLFDIQTSDKSQLEGTTLQLARSIVRVKINAKAYPHTDMRCRRNVYAKPQMLIDITAPSLAALKKDFGKKGHQLEEMLNRFEMKEAINRLQREHNPQAEQKLEKMFGISMKIPSDMLSSKQGKDFLWLSNNANSGMQNICVFWTDNADSVLAVNIKGEQPHMYMRTVPESLIYSHTNERAITRGLWDMVGDAMGGPFVAHTLNVNGRKLTALAFVYAPEMKKRNKMRQTEASLYTMTIKNYHQNGK